MSTTRSDHYKAAGVDIDAADALIERIKPLAAATRIPGATSGPGGFGGVFDLAAAGYAADSPRLVSGTDGVGTKLKLAFATGIHDTIGIDCVAMCVNDILAIGAKPLFFLDYFATGRLAVGTAEAVVAGIAEGCRQSGAWLLGGETAEMPGMYPDGEYDLAGFVVGAVTDETEIRPEHAHVSDVVIGVASSGLHSNGFSLARRVLVDVDGADLDAHLPGDDVPLGQRLLVPTRLYVSALDSVRAAGVRPHAVAHITGGGLWENPQRSIADELAVELDLATLRAMRLPIFDTISARGGVPEREMYRVFNMGIGLTIAVAPADADATITALASAGYEACAIGKLIERNDGPPVRIDGISDQPVPAS